MRSRLHYHASKCTSLFLVFQLFLEKQVESEEVPSGALRAQFDSFSNLEVYQRCTSESKQRSRWMDHCSAINCQPEVTTMLLALSSGLLTQCCLSSAH